MFTYILQIIIFQVLFLAVYDFFLSKETFHKYNRWYLLGTPILSFVLPLIKIPTFQKAMPQEIMVLLPEVMLSPQKIIEQTTFYTDGSINYISLLFWIGVAVFTIVFLVKLFKIMQLIVKNETIKTHFYKLVLLPKRNNAFSFFNYIFLGKEIPLNKKDEIIEHELIHATQKHSVDLLFFELLKIVMWFNPMIYFYQRRITLLHEYISDAAIIKTTQKQEYFNTLLNQTFQVENISFVNQFYKHSLIKKRIIMMTKNKSNQFRKAKYLLLLPLLASMLIYTSCETNQIEDVEEVVQQKQERKIYTEFLDGLKVGKTSNESYLDMYAGTGLPEGKRITPEELTMFEKEEYNKFIKSMENSSVEFKETLIIQLYKKKNGRVTLANIFDFSKMGKRISSLKKVMRNDVPFAIIENVPVFPGCTGTRKERGDCLNKSIRSFVIRNFNGDLAGNLGLPKGKKKVWVAFRIDEQGNVGDAKVIRSPHPKLGEEAIRVVKALPKMEPGKQSGKPVGMKYTLPISFNIE